MSANPERFDFTDDDIKLKEIPVTLGKHGSYVLREADEGTAVNYRNNAIAKTKLEDGKVVKADGIATIEAELVGSCLYPVDSNGQPKGAAVGTSFVYTLPARIVKKLHTWVMDNSGLREKDEGTMGKGSPNATSARSELPAPPG